MDSLTEHEGNTALFTLFALPSHIIMEPSVFSISEMASSTQPASSSASCAPWSPSQLTAGVLQDPLAFEFHWPEDNQTQWPEDNQTQWLEGRQAAWSDGISKAENLESAFMGSGQPDDQGTVEQLKR